MQLQLLTVLVSLLVYGPLYVHSYCPSADQVAPKLASCLSQFNSLTDFTKGPITGTQLNNYCSSSARNTEVQCAENLINECKNSGKTMREVLEKTVNINAIRGSVKILCNNTQIFTEKQDCIGQYQTTVTTCVTRSFANYNSDLQSLKSQAYSKGVEWFKEKAYEGLCDYYGEIADCQKPYGRNCGREVGDVFDALIHAARPPVCAGVMEHVNIVLLISLALVALVKGNL